MLNGLEGVDPEFSGVDKAFEKFLEFGEVDETHRGLVRHEDFAGFVIDTDGCASGSLPK